MTPRRLPDGVDDQAAARIVRTFLLVRIVRGCLLLLFLAVALVGVEANDWPRGVSLAIAVAILAQAAALVAWCRRYARLRRG